MKTRDETVVNTDSISYMPTINAPATQLSTVYEILQQSLNVMTHLRLNSIVCVFDQALYAKAVEIIWKNSERHDGIILRLGVFHTICTLLAVIGKCFKDAGSQDLCIEAGIVAKGSFSGVMEGRRYNRAVRTHKLICEALMRLAWKRFVSWLKVTNPEDNIQLQEAMTAAEDTLVQNPSQVSLENVVKNISFKIVLDKLRHIDSFFETTVANFQVSGFPTWTWLKFCWGFVDLPEKEIGIFTWQAFEP